MTDTTSCARLRFNPRKGWFQVIEWLSGTVDLMGNRHPDKYGCYKRRLVIGPVPTAADAKGMLL